MDYIGVSGDQVGGATRNEMVLRPCMVSRSSHIGPLSTRTIRDRTFIIFTLFPISLLMSRSFSTVTIAVHNSRFQRIRRYIA